MGLNDWGDTNHDGHFDGAEMDRYLYDNGLMPDQPSGYWYDDSSDDDDDDDGYGSSKKPKKKDRDSWLYGDDEDDDEDDDDDWLYGGSDEDDEDDDDDWHDDEDYLADDDDEYDPEKYVYDSLGNIVIERWKLPMLAEAGLLSDDIAELAGYPKSGTASQTSSASAKAKSSLAPASAQRSSKPAPPPPPAPTYVLSESSNGEVVKFPVVGLSYDRRAEIWRVVPLLADPDIQLRAEPDNEHDPNAVAVYLGDYHAGYLPKNLAPKMSAHLQAGGTVEVVGVDVGTVKGTDRAKVTLHVVKRPPASSTSNLAAE